MARKKAIQIDEREVSLIEAEEALVADFQVALHCLMEDKGISRAQLAKVMGVSKARITQLLRAEANPTLRTAARAFGALGESCELSCQHLASLKSEYAIFSDAEHDANWKASIEESASEQARNHRETLMIYDALSSINENPLQTNDNRKQAIDFSWEVRGPHLKVAAG